MKKQDIKKKYNKEKKLLQKYNHHYFNLDSPLVTDSIYDQILEHRNKKNNTFLK
jgi:NAD-dependent DNA ligase